MKVSEVRTTHLQSDISFLLPLQAGHKVGLINGSRTLMEALKDDGLVDTCAAGSDLPLMEPESLDHVVLPSSPGGGLTLISHIRRVLKPGGTLLLGMTPKEANAAERMLKQEGFEILGVYGVRESLNNPQFFVPIETAAATRFFFQQMHAPVSWRSELLRRISRLVTAVGMQRYLFREIAFVAQK